MFDIPAKFDDILKAIKKSIKKDNPSISKDELERKAYAMATKTYQDKYGKNPSGSKVKNSIILENKKINWYSPINEFFVKEQKTGESDLTQKDFIIRGVAITASTTRNGITYLVEELKNSLQSFVDKPVLEDHEPKVRSIVGRTTENIQWDDNINGITFEARIVNETIKQMIKDGLIKNVSIGAMVKRLEEISEGENITKIARGIEGLELSLVATPGDANASISQGLMLNESFGNAIEEAFKEVKSKMVEENITERKNIPLVKDEKKHVDDDDMMEDDDEEDEEPKAPKLKKKTKTVETEEYEKLQSELTQLKESLKSKDEILKQKDAQEFSQLKAEYVKACEKIGVSVKENLTKEAMLIMVESAKEIKKDEPTKGLVIPDTKSQVENSMKDYVFIKEGSKFSMFKDLSARPVAKPRRIGGAFGEIMGG